MKIIFLLIGMVCIFLGINDILNNSIIALLITLGIGNIAEYVARHE